MKCPNCHHVSDMALLQCSACGQTYDRATLESLQHLEYLLTWLDHHEDEIGPRLFTQLHGEVKDSLTAARVELGLTITGPPTVPAPPAIASPPIPPPPAPAPAPAPAVARAPEKIARELALIEAVLARVPAWAKAIRAEAVFEGKLREDLASQAGSLKRELAERPAEVEPPSELHVLEYALKSLPVWAAGSLRPYLEQQRANLLRPASPPPTPVAARPPEEAARELTLIEATLAQVRNWLKAGVVSIRSADDLNTHFATRAEALKKKLAGQTLPIASPSELAVIDFALGLYRSGRPIDSYTVRRLIFCAAI